MRKTNVLSLLIIGILALVGFALVDASRPMFAMNVLMKATILAFVSLWLLHKYRPRR